MEGRFQRIFLIALTVFLAQGALAQDEQESDGQTVLDAVINPEIEPRNIDEDLIDSENFEAGIFAGVMSVEDFGSNNVFGVRLAYHVTEDLFLELASGQTSTTETSYETLSGGSPLLTDAQRTLTYYNVSLGWNLLPGEVYLGKYAFNTSYYIIGGAGNTMFADNEYFTYNFGGGFRMALTDWVAFRLDFRNHLFTHNILGDDKSIQNLETHLGLSLFF
ncbi:outer membrane beta-barrel domain-containing protein [Teredinibacter turnerae]|uniref:outer membrane beta-barrel domain-containing protein n=1 Tax=Teredinibacter turnerae TaxID=2426 RepID=UPI00040350D8|nr:outer membrane beta-barrel domain-containing protein [Teredinibacter turnerae]